MFPSYRLGGQHDPYCYITHAAGEVLDSLEIEPDFLGGEKGRGSTEDSIMADHRLESGIMTVHPIDHEPSVRATEGGSSCRIDLAISLAGIIVA